MVSRLEKLERFFGSRKRDKERGARPKDLPTGSFVSQYHGGPRFPSPSFMHPTAAHMKPREESIPWSTAVKERSQSLPNPHNHLRRRSSISIFPNHRHHPSDPIRATSLSIKQAESHLAIQKLSRFRFPENSDEEENTDVYRGERPVDVSEGEHTAQEFRAENILDWCPQRISSLFNNLGLDTSIDDRLARFSEDGLESLALDASPALSSPPSPRTKVGSIVVPPRWSSEKPGETPTRNSTIMLRNRPLYPISIPLPDSPPASDCEEEYPDASFNRSISARGLASPIEFTPRPSSDSNPCYGNEIPVRGYAIRESWGIRYQDPAPVYSVQDERTSIPPSQHLRKSASIASLSTIVRSVAIDRDIREPTLDEFFALSDEDVAERAPNTLILESEIPPTPPPKDPPETPLGRSRSTRHVPVAPSTAINISSGELTPPQTPVDSHFLTLSYSPSTTSGASGAVWAASIAKAYNFDLVYVVSLWPSGAKNKSGQLSYQSPHAIHQNSTQGTNRTTVAHPKSGITGRLLAAYGLNEFGSPFRIHAQFHKGMLGRKGWNEYRDELASPRMISRGWACSFYTDNISTVPDKIGGNRLARGRVATRGIVFAAYTRKTTKSVIPVRSSPRQTAILGKLFFDAQTLVDTLVHGA